LDEKKQGLIRYVGVSADGRLALAGDSEGTIQIWDLAARTLIREISYPAMDWRTAPCYSFTPDGKVAIIGRRNGETLTLWDLTRGSKTRVFETKEPVGSVALSPDGKLALSATVHKVLEEGLERSRFLVAIRLWDTSSGKLLKTFLEGCRTGGCVAFSPNGKLAAAATGGAYDASGNVEGFDLRVWDVGTGREEPPLGAVDEDNVTCFAFSADGKHIAAGYRHKVSKWQLGTTKPLWTVPTGLRRWSPRSIAFSPDSKAVLAGGNETDYVVRLPEQGARGGLLLLSANTGKEDPKFAEVKEWIREVSFSPDAKRALAATGSGLRAWDVETGQSVFTLRKE
jgi:WD40 repeat protein